MPNTVHLQLRSDSNLRDPVDLDELSPRARVLAEAVDQSDLSTRGEIWMEHSQPIRDREPNWRLWYTEEQAAQPERRPWRGWAAYLPHSSMSPVEYLEREARKIPPDWHVVGRSLDTPVSSLDAGAADQGMTRDMVLRYLRDAGRNIGPSTWSSYVARGQAPKPARHVQRTPLWERADIDAWLGRQR
jgi:hypothetical protein